MRECLALFFIKLRTGLSNAILSTLFGMEKRRVGIGIMTARTGLMSFIVPHHLGVGHISPESATRDHTTSMAKTLFANGKDVLGCSKSFESDIYRAVEEPKLLRHFKISSFI